MTSQGKCAIHFSTGSGTQPYKSFSEAELNAIIANLIWKYPSHSQVLDLDECKSLGLNARAAEPSEESVLRAVASNLDNLVYVGSLAEESSDASATAAATG